MQVKVPAGRRKCLFEGWVGKAGTLAAPVWQKIRLFFFGKPGRPCNVATMPSPCTGWRRQGRRNSLRFLLTRAQHDSTPLERTELHIWATHWGNGNHPPSLLEQLQDPGATSPFLFLSASCQPFVLRKTFLRIGTCWRMLCHNVVLRSVNRCATTQKHPDHPPYLMGVRIGRQTYTECCS